MFRVNRDVLYSPEKGKDQGVPTVLHRPGKMLIAQSRGWQACIFPLQKTLNKNNGFEDAGHLQL
jgi:hypothetical protein